MSIPATLFPGSVSIYGIGNPNGSINGLVPQPGFLFGVIDQTWGSMPDIAANGNSVMYKESDIISTVVYSNWPYTIIPENKIVLIENIPV